MKWNTKQIVYDLTNLVGSKGRINVEKDPQGECYCRDIFVDVDEEDGVSIIGFNDDGCDLSDVDTPDEDVEYVEIRNYHSDSSGGLSKDASKKIREIYFIVLDYFNVNYSVQVVDNLHDFF